MSKQVLFGGPNNELRITVVTEGDLFEVDIFAAPIGFKLEAKVEQDRHQTYVNVRGKIVDKYPPVKV